MCAQMREVGGFAWVRASADVCGDAARHFACVLTTAAGRRPRREASAPSVLAQQLCSRSHQLQGVCCVCWSAVHWAVPTKRSRRWTPTCPQRPPAPGRAQRTLPASAAALVLRCTGRHDTRPHADTLPLHKRLHTRPSDRLGRLHSSRLRIRHPRSCRFRRRRRARPRNRCTGSSPGKHLAGTRCPRRS